jgi:hypothetical protein
MLHSLRHCLHALCTLRILRTLLALCTHRASQRPTRLTTVSSCVRTRRSTPRCSASCRRACCARKVGSHACLLAAT